MSFDEIFDLTAGVYFKIIYQFFHEDHFFSYDPWINQRKPGL